MGWGGGNGQVRGATQSVIEINTNPHMYNQVCLHDGWGLGGGGARGIGDRGGGGGEHDSCRESGALT